MKVRGTGEGIQIYDFDSVEALKMARNLEIKGIRFYDDLLNKTMDTAAKEVLSYLREQEKEHLVIFERLLQREEPAALDDDEDSLFASVDNGVFAQSGEEIAETDFDAALAVGVNIEKRSLAFYLEVMKYMEDEEGRNTLKKIINEEKKHWEELQRLAR